MELWYFFDFIRVSLALFLLPVCQQQLPSSQLRLGGNKTDDDVQRFIFLGLVWAGLSWHRLSIQRLELFKQLLVVLVLVCAPAALRLGLDGQAVMSLGVVF